MELSEITEIVKKIKLLEAKQKKLELLKNRLNLTPGFCRDLNETLSLQNKLNNLYSELYEIQNAKEGDTINPIRNLELVNTLIPDLKNKLEQRKSWIFKHIENGNLLVLDDLNIEELTYMIDPHGNVDIVNTISENILYIYKEISDYNLALQANKPKWYKFSQRAEYRNILKMLNKTLETQGDNNVSTVSATPTTTRNHFKNNLICHAINPNIPNMPIANQNEIEDLEK